MNERIKQLAEQAQLLQERDGDVYLLEHATGELEKFAELIIKECTDMTKSNGMPRISKDDIESIIQFGKEHGMSSDYMDGFLSGIEWTEKKLLGK